MNKICTECLIEKPLSEFYKDAKSPGGHRKNCKECKNKKTVIWRNANREHYNKIARDHHKKHYQKFRLQRYGITPEVHAATLKSQDNKCAICEKINSSTKRSLATDHDHATGEFRGIVCYGCNRLLVLLDNKDLLAKALAYLDKNKS